MSKETTLESTLTALYQNQLTHLTFNEIKKKNDDEYNLVNTLLGHTSMVRCVTALLSGQLISGSYDNTLKLWDIQSGKCLQTLTGHTSVVRCIAELMEGQVVSGSLDKKLKVWDIPTGKCLQTLTGHKDIVYGVTVLPSGHIVSCSGDKTLKVWDIQTGKCQQTLMGHTSGVRCVATLPRGQVVSGSEDYTIKMWDIQNNQCLQTLKGHCHYVNCVVVLPDGHVISGSDDCTLKVWDVHGGNCLQTLKGHTNYIWSVGVLANGKIVSGACDKTLKMWDLKSEECLLTLHGHTDRVWSVTILPNGQIVSGSKDKTLKVWGNPFITITPLEKQLILQAVANNSSLKILNLSKVMLSEIPHAITCLKDTLLKHPSLTTLDLSHTGLTDAMLGELLPILHIRKQINNIAVEGNILSLTASLRLQNYLDNLLNVPSPSCETQEYQEKSWHFDPQTKAKRITANNVYELIEATDKDKSKVIQFYEHQPVPGYDIASIDVIYNPTMNHKFALYMAELHQRYNNPAFIPKWQTGQENGQEPAEATEQIAWRHKINEIFERMAKPFQDCDYPSVKLLPMWHGTNTTVIDSIFRTGYANLATTDSGFFGKGIYGSHEAEYSYRVYAKHDGALILNWTACFSAYPVIDGDRGKFMMKNEKGQDVSMGNYSNYDAHFVPVVPFNPENPNEVIYSPTRPNQSHQYTELVVFQSAACLPRYLVQLQPVLLKSVTIKSSQVAVSDKEPTLPISQWDKQRVYQKLKQDKDFSSCAEPFLKEDIDGRALIVLEDKDLKELGMSLGLRKKFPSFLKELSSMIIQTPTNPNE